MLNQSPNRPHPITALKTLLPQCMLQDRVRIERSLNRRNLSSEEVECLLDQARNSAHLRARRRENRPVPTYPPALPISDRRDEILAAVQAHPVVVVAGETGSGKSTQLPKICLAAGRGDAGRIAVTQPRRVAALSIAQRIAEELGVSYGRDVGCKIRFRDQTAPETCIKVMTDGMLLAETQADPDLLEYDTIIVDEAHERSLNIDFLLGYLRLLGCALFHREQILPLRQRDFDAVLEQAKKQLHRLAPRFISLIDSLLKARRATRLAGWTPTWSACCQTTSLPASPIPVSAICAATSRPLRCAERTATDPRKDAQKAIQMFVTSQW